MPSAFDLGLALLAICDAAGAQESFGGSTRPPRRRSDGGKRWRSFLTGGEAAGAFLAANRPGPGGRRSDKTTRHTYHESYGPLLLGYLNQPEVAVLEIGVQDGHSLALWGRLFPRLALTVGLGYGVGTMAGSRFREELAPAPERVLLYHGDQSNASFLERMRLDLNGTRFDVIIDDGSHVPWHNIFTLEEIFGTLLADGGIYVIEDTETSYWDGEAANLYGMYDLRGGGVGTHGSAVERLKLVPDVLNRHYLRDAHFSVLRNRVDHMVASITFARNCVALVKKDPARWASLEHLDSGEYAEKNGLRGRTERSPRKKYKAWKATTEWKVTGTPG